MSAHPHVRSNDRRAAAAIGTILLLVLIAVMSLLVGRYVYHAAVLLQYPYDWDEDEGLSIYFADRIAAGLPIYVDFNQLPMLSACYPPVYHAVVSLPVRAFGPTLLAGRLVSLIATAGLCTLILAIVRQETRRWDLATLAAAMALGSPAVITFTPLARADALAVCTALAGLALVRQYPQRRLAPVIGLDLLVAACFTKCQMIILAAAAFWHIGRTSRPAAIIAAAAFAAAVITVLITLITVTDGRFLQCTLALQDSQFRVLVLAGHTRMFLEQHALLVTGTAGWIVYALARRDLDLWAAAALASLPILALTGKIGATINYFIPLVVTTVICTALAVDRLQKNLPPAWAHGSTGLILLLLIIQGVVWGLQPIRLPTNADRQAADRVLDTIRTTRGDVLTERCVTFSLLAGRQPQIDACTLGLAYRSTPAMAAARWDPAPLTRAIEQKRYPLILLERRYYPPEVIEAIDRHYRPLDDQPITLGFTHGRTRYHLLVPR